MFPIIVIVMKRWTRKGSYKNKQINFYYFCVLYCLWRPIYTKNIDVLGKNCTGLIQRLKIYGVTFIELKDANMAHASNNMVIFLTNHYDKSVVLNTKINILICGLIYYVCVFLAVVMYFEKSVKLNFIVVTLLYAN